MNYVKRELVRKCFAERPPWSHKGDYGRLLVIGGSGRYSGSPALAALAALRSGCDLVTVAAPRRPADIIASFSPDIITEPLSGNFLSRRHIPAVLRLISAADAVVLGGGMERRRESVDFAVTAISKCAKPMVIDADGIYAASLVKAKLNSSFVLTPHSMEFRELTGAYPPSGIKERSHLTSMASERRGCTVLLKGHTDVIAFRRDCILNSTGTPFMTKGGTGDTLSGICGGFLAMGLPPFRAAYCSAFINGLAGEFAAVASGQGMLASDLVSQIPRAISSALR